MAPVLIAMTETKNAFDAMPKRVEGLSALEGRLDDIRQQNVEHHVALIRTAAARGVKMVGLGELFTAPYFASTHLPMWTGLAESTTDGPTVTRLRAVAGELEVVIVAPIFELAQNGKRYNTAVVIDADGTRLGQYRKTHIPHGGNEQGDFYEGHYYGRADGDADMFPAFRTRHGTIGVAICYDRHFEGVMRSLKTAGAALVFCPAVTFGEKSKRMWQMEFDVDAARHRLFIAGSNRAGAEPPFGVTYFGQSLVAGPDGRVPVDRSYAGLVIADVDLDTIAHPDPSGWRLLQDRRPAIYTGS